MGRFRKPSKRLLAKLQRNKRRDWTETRAKEQGHKCFWCGLPMKPEQPGGRTCGHVIPMSRDGPDHFENVAAMHEWCNLAQGSLLPEEFCEPGKFDAREARKAFFAARY